MVYNYQLSGCASPLFPMEIVSAFFSVDDILMEIPKQTPFHNVWGQPISLCIRVHHNLAFPDKLEMIWLSLVEKNFYSLIIDLPKQKMESFWEEYVESASLTHILVGMAPYGNVALWMAGTKKTKLVEWVRGKLEIQGVENYFIGNETITFFDYCDYYLNEYSEVIDNLQSYGLPPRNLFDKYMQQFNYRYVPHFMHWDDDAEDWLPYEEGECIPEFDYIEEALFDGTHDKLHDGGLLKYHSAGKPKKLAVKWHVKKAQYTAYFWMEEDIIADIFEKFYGAHPDTQADLELHVDYERNIFEFSFYRHGLREPLYFSPDTYQLIVFKDGFERFRSENYDQPHGAWVW